MVNTFFPTQNASKNAHIPSFDRYDEIYKRSIEDPENFWAETAQRIHWIKPWDTVRNFDFVQGRIEWFSGGKLNACYNCIDRHIENGHGMKQQLSGKEMTPIRPGNFHILNC